MSPGAAPGAWLRCRRAGAWLLSAALLLLGCQSIAGIEERRLGSSAACEDYCSGIEAICVLDLNPYFTPQACRGVCRLLDPGDPMTEPVGNTLACRVHVLEEAALEPNTYCGMAGPGGKKNGVESCGGECESYCTLLSRACSDDFQDDFDSHQDCVTKCAALRSDIGFGAEAHYQGDTLQCRLVHVSSASVTSNPHCDHSRILPSAPCVDDAKAEPNCEDYCRIVMVACDGLRVYESSTQCRRACEALGETLGYGAIGDRSENSIGCRQYHAYNALLSPAAHCAHAGPTGDGHCFNGDPDEGNCQSYCALVSQACPGQAKDAATCQAECLELDGHLADSHFSVTGAGAETQVGCRMRHALLALDNPSECPAALGSVTCP